MKNLRDSALALGVFVSRLRIFPANISLVGSFGFFNQNFWFYAATIILFDGFVGGWYQGFIFTYLGFLGYYLLGKIARDNRKKQVVLLPVASLLFFLMSNFGVWLRWYPQTLTGFIKCYTLALPFYRNTLIGDLAFGYGYLLVSHLVKNYSWQKHTLVSSKHP